MTDTGLSRRAVLSGAAVLAAAACSGGSTGRRTSGPGPVSPTGGASRRPGRASATAADWRALGRSLTGRLLRPGDPSYSTAHRLYDPRFDHLRPAGVVEAGSADDVSRAVTFAGRHGLPLHLRAGGHSYLGASTGHGLVVDVRPLSRIDVGGSGTARFGAGVRLIDAYGTLAGHGLSIPAGSCPTVGLTGLSLGGGVGVLTRLQGLTCDQLDSADVVTANGDQVTVSADRHPDLFFALRGGGGSFAAVTSLTLRTHPAPPTLTVFNLGWPWSSAAAVLAAWMPWCTGVPDQLWSTCHLLSTNTAGPPTVAVSGVYAGPAVTAEPYLDRLASAVGAEPSSRYASDRGYLDTMLLEAGCDHETVEQCHLVGSSPDATVQRTTFVAASDFYDRPIPRAGVAAVVRAVEARQADAALGIGGVAFDALGGAVARVPVGATAFAHRRADFNAQWSASWPVGRPGDQAANERSLMKLQASARRYSIGAYCNYPTAGRRDAAVAYWGVNLPRLRAIKRRWDPHGIFDQPQGVRG